MVNKYLLLISILSFNSVDSQNICNFTVSMNRAILCTGFHRNLTYEIQFENHSLHNKNKPVYFYDGCILAVQQLLPAGIYVDPDELDNLRRNNLLSAFPHNGMNIEVAAPYARPFNAYIFSLVKFNKVQTFLPAHARYQSPAAGGGKAENPIIAPTTYLRCPDRRLEDCDMPIKTKSYLCDKDSLAEETCVWKQIESTGCKGTLMWDVPVGDLDHYYVVEVVTMLAVVSGSLALMYAIHHHRVSFNPKRVETVLNIKRG